MNRMAVVVGAALLGLSVPAQAELVVNISKSQQRLAVMVNGTEAHRWPISTGTNRTPTPAGVFRPQRLERHWYSRKYNLTPMPWSIFFHRGYAVHGTMEAHNLGRQASHGCVRLRPDNAATLYSMVRRHGMKGTKVVVLNGPLPALQKPLEQTPLPPTPPRNGPMAFAEATAVTGHFAKAAPEDADKAAAEINRDFSAARHDAVPEPRPRPRARLASADSYRVSVGSNEAQILREREAWLRGLDRKYGISR
ncbi:MAG: L,D-transpeptidase [Pseudolabrys sp.]|nr:L,D-transpeptidase [Pseudolabrys sp.]